MKKFWILALFFWFPLSACTDFVITAADNSIVNGRSMEFGINLEAQIAIFPAGTKFGSAGEHSWKSKYACIGMTVFDLDFICDGMNEKGLSLGALWFPGTQYPKVEPHSSKISIALQDLNSWILGNFSTVEEVKAGLQMIQVIPQKISQLGDVPPLHLSLHDRLGKSLVVEFIDGQMQISDNEVGVLTNAPKFEWHVTNLRNYINLSAINVKPTKLDGSVLSPTGQGSGLLGIPGDWTPPSRFVRISAFKNFVTKAENATKNKNLAFHLLNTVDIPYGAIRDSGDKNFDFTQWVVVKDLTNSRMYYRTYADLDIRVINLEAAVKKAGTSIQKIPL